MEKPVTSQQNVSPIRKALSEHVLEFAHSPRQRPASASPLPQSSTPETAAVVSASKPDAKPSPSGKLSYQQVDDYAIELVRRNLPEAEALAQIKEFLGQSATGESAHAYYERAVNAVNKRVVVQRASAVTTKKLRWLWPERVPFGKHTTYAGIPGEGKSLVTVDVAARVTRGIDFPDAKNPLPPSDVLFISGEDDAEDALVPRLIAAGADLNRVHIHRSVLLREGNEDVERALRLDEDLSEVKRYIENCPDIRLIIIDPITNHMGSASMLSEQETRALLAPMKMKNAAVVLVDHLNKKAGLSAIHRVGGAGAFIGMARASWLFTRDLEDSRKHLMLPLKNNYARDGLKGLAYRIGERPVRIEDENVPTPYVEWLGETSETADEALTPDKNKSMFSKAIEFLSFQLATGPQDADAMYEAAGKQGISERTLERAKAELKVRSQHPVDGSGKKGLNWEWVLPDEKGG